MTSVRVGQDAGGITRCEEASLLLRLASEHSFPCGTNPSTILPILAAHLGLKLHEEDPQGWEAVKAVFQRAQPWAVSDGGGFWENGGNIVFHFEVRYMGKCEHRCNRLRSMDISRDIPYVPYVPYVPSSAL